MVITRKLANKMYYNCKMRDIKLRIWHRYASNGEVEKEVEDWEIEALNIHSGFKIISQKHYSFNAIPFLYGEVVNNEVKTWYKPSFINPKNSDFDKSLSELTKEY